MTRHWFAKSKYKHAHRLAHVPINKIGLFIMLLPVVVMGAIGSALIDKLPDIPSKELLPIVVAVIVPLVALAMLALLNYFLYKHKIDWKHTEAEYKNGRLIKPRSTVDLQHNGDGSVV